MSTSRRQFLRGLLVSSGLLMSGATMAFVDKRPGAFGRHHLQRILDYLDNPPIERHPIVFLPREGMKRLGLVDGEIRNGFVCFTAPGPVYKWHTIELPPGAEI